MKEYDVPFYSNTEDNTHCFQAALRMVLKFFLRDKEFTWKELETATAKVEGLWTWPMAGLIWLSKNDFEIKNIEAFDYTQFIQKRGDYLFELFGKEVAEAQIKHSDINQEIRYAEIFIEAINTEVRLPSIKEIPELLDDGYLLICNVNSRVLNKMEGYTGHSIVVKGYDGHSFTIHDPGLPPMENRKIDFETFESAWAYPNENAKNIMAFKLK